MLPTDIRHAVRSLGHRPGFAILVITTLGLGIGTTTTIFSAVYRLNYAPLPYETADRLVNLGRTQEGAGFFVGPSPGVVEAWRAESQLLEHVVMAVPVELTLIGRGEPIALVGARVSPDLPQMLRDDPLLGRSFTAAEAEAGARVVVLSEAVWRTHFGSDRGVIGAAIRLGEEVRTVIGVMSDDFARYSEPYPRQEFWLPYRREQADEYGGALRLLREGVTLEAASEELDRIASGVDAGASSQGRSYRALSLSELLSARTQTTLPILFGAVALVLLIACANVGALMIVRLNVRRRELAIRAALGAHHRRILDGLIVEQLMLALGAGVVGLLIAAWSISLIAQLAPAAIPLIDTLRLDPAVLLFAAGLLLLATLFAGVLPAHSVLRHDPADSLRAGGERVTGGGRSRSILVTGQIALSVVLLVGSVLLIRSFDALESRDPGFDANGVLVVELSLPHERYAAEQKAPVLSDIVEGLRVIPGVTVAGVGGGVPPHLGLVLGSLTVDGSDVSTEGISYVAGTSAAPGFLAALGARFSAGRDFTETDRDMNAVVVNRSFVERFWPGEEGTGRRMKLLSVPEAPWIEIVGVIEDIRAGGPASGVDDLHVFYPLETAQPTHSLVIRTDRDDPLSLLPAVRQVVARIDPHLALRDVSTLEQRMAESIARERFSTVLLSLLAGLAVVLSVVGLYGLIAWTVQQRMREIAIRVALGATAASVRSLFLLRGMRLVIIGLSLGVVGALFAVRLMQSSVYELPVHDPLSFAAAVTLMGAVALLAGWLPARGAARVDPLKSLSAE